LIGSAIRHNGQVSWRPNHSSAHAALRKGDQGDALTEQKHKKLLDSVNMIEAPQKDNDDNLPGYVHS